MQSSIIQPSRERQWHIIDWLSLPLSWQRACDKRRNQHSTCCPSGGILRSTKVTQSWSAALQRFPIASLGASTSGFSVYLLGIKMSTGCQWILIEWSVTKGQNNEFCFFGHLNIWKHDKEPFLYLHYFSFFISVNVCYVVWFQGKFNQQELFNVGNIWFTSDNMVRYLSLAELERI